MGKQKIEIKLIENEKARKKVFFKRKNSLVKKAKELSILCDVNVFLIIYELGKQTPEIWNHGEAAEIINTFKQQRHFRGGTKRARANPFASEKKGFLEKFSVSDLKNMINHLPGNELRMLCSELDAKIAAVLNQIKPKQAVTEEPRLLNMLSDGQETGPLSKEKGKEVVTHQEPVHIQEDQSFQMLPYIPTFMENPIMMMMNGIGNPEFDGSSPSINVQCIDGSSPSINVQCNPIPIHYVHPSMMVNGFSNPELDGSSTSTNVPCNPIPIHYVHLSMMMNGISDGSSTSTNVPCNPIPIHYVHPSMMMNGISNPEFDGSSTSTNVPCNPNTTHHIPPGFYYPMMPMPEFPSQMNQ